MYYNPYDPNPTNQPPYPPGTILPAGNTYGAPTGGAGDYYNQDPYAQQHVPTPDFYQQSPRPYEDQRFKVNPSYADTVHIDTQPYDPFAQPQSQYSQQQYSQQQYSQQDQYNQPNQYAPTNTYAPNSPGPSASTGAGYNPYNISTPSYASPVANYSQTAPSQNSWQPQQQQFGSTNTTTSLTPQWAPPSTAGKHQSIAQTLYSQSQSQLQPEQQYQRPISTSSGVMSSPKESPPLRPQSVPSGVIPPISPSVYAPALPPKPTGVQVQQPNAANQQALLEERQRMERERTELLQQQEQMKRQQAELKAQEEAMKALHAQEEQKLRNEIQRQREEVERMKADLTKQSAEQQQIHVQKDRVIEIQKGEMQRQMDELMKEREMVKKHEEEMRNSLLEEQRLMLQQLKQQQSEVSQQQQAIYSQAQQAEQQRLMEYNRKLAEQRQHEADLQKSRQAIEAQQQAVLRQVEEAKAATRAMEEKQRKLADQQKQAEAQQKQTEEQRRQAEQQRKQLEDQMQVALKQQQQQQALAAKQQEELKKKQEQLVAEQERLKSQSKENEAKIENEKKMVEAQLQAQQRALQQQQEDIKRQQELVTFQQKELLVKQKDQLETSEKEKATAAIKDLLAPMRLTVQSPIKPSQTAVGNVGDKQPTPALQIGNRVQSPPQPTQKPPQPPQVQAAPPMPTTPRIKGTDSRTAASINLDQVVDGYLVRDVVRAQRYARRWLTRRRFVKLVEQYHISDDKMAEKLRHRNKALHEIYTSELSYVSSLQLLSNFYVVPMQVEAMVKKTFSDKDIFSSANTLLDVSKGLVAELEARLDKWPSVQLFGDIFVRLAPVMKLYAEYINNFDAAAQRLKTLLATPEGFAFFTNCRTKSRSNLDVNSLLIMPVQRVPRYELLLRELIRFTEESHVDYQNLVLAQKAIQQVNTYINQKKKDVDSRQKMSMIPSQVKNCPSLMVAHRYYLFEGPLQVSTTDKHKTGLFYFFLFNDMLMATKRTGGLFHHKHEFEFVFSIDLAGAVVKRVAENVMFRLMIGGLEDINVAIYTFLCQSLAEKENWLKHFSSIGEDSTGGAKKGVLVKEASVAGFKA